MRLKILSRFIGKHSTCYAHPVPVLMNRVELWHLPNVSPSCSCSPIAKHDRRFCSSAITSTSCNTVQNVSTNFETRESKSGELDNPFLSRITDFHHFDENCKSSLEKCAGHLASLSNDQLEMLLRNILSVRNKINYDDLLKFTYAIDQEFINRSASWTMERMLVYFELYCNLPRLKRTDFVHHLLKRWQHKIFRYDLQVVTKFVRLMNKCDLWSIYHVPKYDYEIYFSNNLAKLSISELEVFLEFMVKVRLVVNTPNLFHEFCTFVLEKLPELSSFGVRWFCQILWLRRSVGFDREFIDSTVVEQLFRYIGKSEHFHANVYIEAASLCREDSLVDVHFFPKFSRKFVHHLDDLSAPRLAEGLNWLSYFDEKSKYASVYDCVVNKLRAKSFNEIARHPQGFILTMYYLSRVGVYPADLLDLLFSPKFLAQAYPKGLTRFLLRDYRVIGQELLTIDGGVAIECPDYEGNRLDAAVRHNILRYYCWKVPKLLSRDLEGVNFDELMQFSRASTRMLYSTRLALEKVLGGSEFVHTGYLLPHLPRPNLLFATNKEGTLVPLASSICQVIVDRNAMDSNLEWYTFGISSFGDRASGNEDNGFRAEEIPKVRQLKKMGFKVLTLMHKEWCDKSETEIEHCLRNKIYSHVESAFQR